MQPSTRTKPVPASRSHVADWERTQKPRVWKGQLRLLLIALLALVSYLALPVLLYATTRLILQPAGGWQALTLGSFITYVGSLVFGLILSTTVRCKLCQGYPMLGKKCRKHVLANKLPFFTYRASVMLHLICTLKFRCMYCSTPFRLGTKKDTHTAQPNSVS